MSISKLWRKNQVWAPLLAAAILAGCSNHEVDAAKLKAAFQSADDPTRQEVDAGLADVNAGKYPEALKVFQHTAFAAKLTKEQSEILTDSIKKVRAKIQ